MLKRILFAIGVSVLITYIGLRAVTEYVNKYEDYALSQKLAQYTKQNLRYIMFNSSKFIAPPRFCFFNCKPSPNIYACRDVCSEWASKHDHNVIDIFVNSKGECYCFYE